MVLITFRLQNYSFGSIAYIKFISGNFKTPARAVYGPVISVVAQLSRRIMLRE